MDQTLPSHSFIVNASHSCSLAVVALFCGEGASATRLNMFCAKKKWIQQGRCLGLYATGNGYFWSLCQRTNYTQVTAILGVTLSNFYPIVFVHTFWLSYQYVCILYLSEGGREYVWPGGPMGVCVCVLFQGLHWPAWLEVNQSCWISVSYLSHPIQVTHTSRTTAAVGC